MQCYGMGYAWDQEECSVMEWVTPGITRNAMLWNRLRLGSRGMQCYGMGYAWDNAKCSVMEWVTPRITRNAVLWNGLRLG